VNHNRSGDKIVDCTSSFVGEQDNKLAPIPDLLQDVYDTEPRSMIRLQQVVALRESKGRILLCIDLYHDSNDEIEEHYCVQKVHRGAFPGLKPANVGPIGFCDFDGYSKLAGSASESGVEEDIAQGKKDGVQNCDGDS